LGEHRIASVLRSLEAIRDVAASTPDIAFALMHVPVRLKSRTADDAAREFAELIEQRAPGLKWAVTTKVDAEGNRTGRASLYLPNAAVASVDWLFLFSMFDLHTRLGAYWLTNIWRALELTEAAAEALAGWHVLVAAACARSILEGAAAFRVNARKLIDEWDAFKRKGKPTVETIETFEDTFTRLLMRSQYASRLSATVDKSELFRSPNILNYIEKLSEGVKGYDVPTIYEWLCDAVHPSFGSMSAFTIERGMHDSKTHIIEVYARKPLSQGKSAVRADVAQASADAMAIANTCLLDDLSRIRWILDDIGLTSGVAFGHTKGAELLEPVARIGALDQPDRNQLCPCGSGKKFKKCVHEWGMPGTPPPNG
jgi:hypothetical protein